MAEESSAATSAALSASSVENNTSTEESNATEKSKVDIVKESQEATVAKEAEEKIRQASQKIQDELSDASKKATEEIQKALKEFRYITSNLKNLCDTNATWSMVEENASIQMAPYIRVAEYYKDSAMEMVKGITQPEDSPIVQEKAEKYLQTMADGFKQILPAVKTFAQYVPDIPVILPINGIIESLESVVTIAETNIPNDQLDAMLTQKINCEAVQAELTEEQKKKAEEFAKKLANAIENPDNKVKDEFEEMEQNASEAKGSVTDFIKEMGKCIGQEAKQIWTNFQPPEIPEDLDSTVEQFIKAVMQVCANIDKVIIVVLLKMVGKIVECLQKIAEKLGIPELPDPLGKILNMIPDAIYIFGLIITFPISLEIQLRAIIKNKIKQLAYGMTTPDSIPLQEQQETKVKGDGDSSDEKKKYIVTFKNANGKVIKEQTVEEGGSATPPYAGAWSGGSYTNVTSNVTLTFIDTASGASFESGTASTPTEEKQKATS